MSENSGTAKSSSSSTSGAENSRTVPWKFGSAPWKTALTHPWVWGYIAISAVTMVILQVSFVLQSMAIAGLAFAMYSLVHCVRDRIALIPDSGFSLAGKALLLSTVLNCLVALLVNQYGYLILTDWRSDVMGANLTIAFATILGWIYAVFSGVVGTANLFFLTACRSRLAPGPVWKPLVITALTSSGIGIAAFVAFNVLQHGGNDLYLVGAFLVMLGIRILGDLVISRTVPTE